MLAHDHHDCDHSEIKKISVPNQCAYILLSDLKNLSMYKKTCAHTSQLTKATVKFLNQVHTAEGCAHLVSWNCFGSPVGMCVCLSVCRPPRAVITSGVIWYDIGRVQLVKQASRLFSAFNYFTIMTLSVDKMDGHVHILTQHVVNACQRKLRWSGATKGYRNSFIKVSGRMCSDIFKRRLTFNFIVTILA